MAVAVVHSRALDGLNAAPVTVEVHISGGLPGFTIVGLPETEVKEARDRVRAALKTCQFKFPAVRVTVNLATADLPKEGGRFDLPIALGILVASEQLPAERLAAFEFIGELSLTGALRPIRGALVTTFHTTDLRRALVLPAENAAEAALVRAAELYPARHLLEVAAHLSGATPLPIYTGAVRPVAASYPDLSDIKGQAAAKRAVEIAACGAHSMLLVGPPGTGKSMLASRLPGVLPPMSETEALESAAVYSLAQGEFPLERWCQRPYRNPHHTASGVALVGGGSTPRPGEISLAHHGVLFLDELPEFDRRVLEVLREPLESGRISIARAARQAEFPAEFQLVAAMNPCACGYLGDAGGRCRCTPDQVQRYHGKISGPLLDRIDLIVDVPAVPESELFAPGAGEASALVRTRVEAARERQLRRQGKANARLAPGEIDRVCALDVKAAGLLKQGMQRLRLSARAVHRVLKLARSIADLSGGDAIATAHIAEALQYRRPLLDND